MGLGAKEVVLSPAAEAALAELESPGAEPRRASIAKRVRQYGQILRVDCLHGEVVRQQYIPRQLAERYGLANLYVEDLPDFWRLLYTVTHAGPDRFVIVLEIVDHRTYDRWFPGRRR